MISPVFFSFSIVFSLVSSIVVIKGPKIRYRGRIDGPDDPCHRVFNRIGNMPYACCLFRNARNDCAAASRLLVCTQSSRAGYPRHSANNCRLNPCVQHLNLVDAPVGTRDYLVVETDSSSLDAISVVRSQVQVKGIRDSDTKLSNSFVNDASAARISFKSFLACSFSSSSLFLWEAKTTQSRLSSIWSRKMRSFSAAIF